MTFILENANTTYQRIMDVVFSHQIRQILEVYVDNMKVKTTEVHKYAKDLKDVLQSVKK